MARHGRLDKEERGFRMVRRLPSWKGQVIIEETHEHEEGVIIDALTG